MKAKAVRLYGKNDLRLEEFELPPIRENEILAEVISDSLCMSSYKATSQGASHKRVPDDVAQNPVIIGHEFAGKILEVGSKWKGAFRPGQKYTVQPALGEVTEQAAGYSYRWFGGNTTHVIIPPIFLEHGCIMPFEGDSYFMSSLAEPYSCVAATFRAHYHSRYGSYVHEMGIREDGKMAMLGAAGPMGVAAIDFIVHADRRPSLLVVTDINQQRLDYISRLISPEEARSRGIDLHYVNTAEKDTAYLKSLTGKQQGYDDVLVFAAVRSVVEQGEELLAFDGCLNFFAGPSDTNFSAEVNFYRLHYQLTHFIATSGGNTDDLRQSIDMMVNGKLHPQFLVTHIGGLDSAIPATVNLPGLSGAKKLIYTHISLPLTAVSDFEEKGKEDPLYAALHEICMRHNGLWNAEAEHYLLARGKPIF